MSEFEGTPGPWFISSKKELVVEGDMNVIQTHGANCLGFHIAYASGWTDDVSTRAEALNNANIIAAAPELLEALREMVAIVKKNSYPCPDKPNSNCARAEAAEAVIAKALGK